MNLFIELNNLSSKYRFYPKKGSKTHFITDEKLIAQIVFLAELKKPDKVLEINAGEFFLAREVSKKSSLTAFEKRPELLPMLKNELHETEIIFSSFLSFSANINANKCVSFLSLDDSGQIFSKLVFLDFDLMVLLLQKDFSQRILAEPGFSDYSALTVLTNAFFEINKEREINSDSFFPRTSSDFFLIKFRKKKKTKIKNKKDFFEFVKSLFRFKNRVFPVALAKALPLMKLDKKTKQKIKSNISELDFNDKVYLMETADFIELFSLLNK